MPNVIDNVTLRYKITAINGNLRPLKTVEKFFYKLKKWQHYNCEEKFFYAISTLYLLRGMYAPKTTTFHTNSNLKTEQ